MKQIFYILLGVTYVILYPLALLFRTTVLLSHRSSYGFLSDLSIQIWTFLPMTLIVFAALSFVLSVTDENRALKTYTEKIKLIFLPFVLIIIGFLVSSMTA